MNKFVTIVLITLYLIPQNVKSHKRNQSFGQFICMLNEQTAQ